MLLQRAGLHPGEAAHVGDDPAADVEGARGAGLLPVWLNRDAAQWQLETSPPEIVIAGLDELPAVLEAANQP
jgi:FMN phosphatase YigB (HAD superfamily)